MSRDAIVPEEWAEAAVDAGWAVEAYEYPAVQEERRKVMRRALEAVVPLAEQRATRSLLKAREETEGR